LRARSLSAIIAKPSMPSHTAQRGPAPLTRRLYYDDAFLREFEGTVTEARPGEGVSWVALDRTAFYPGGGGQPHDRGTLGGRGVQAIEERDGAVWHALDGQGSPGAGDSVAGSIDWPRRFDHMQQHTGQHILSASFLEVAGAETRSFHMGAERSTIDVAHPGPDAGLLSRVEDRANEIVWEDREIAIHIAPREEVHRFPLRKPPTVDGDVRIVEISGYDWSACGGTHVRRAGQIGVIAVVGTERYKGGTRVEFVCGGRALRHHREAGRLLHGIANDFSVGPSDLPAAIARLKEELAHADRRAKGLLRESLEREAVALVEEGAPGARGPVVARHFPDRDPAEVGTLAALISARGGIALLFAGGETARAHFSAPPGTISMAELLGSICRRHGGKGGGRPESAQGAVPGASLPAALEEALRFARSGTWEGTMA
jgi:alanyl-tRNA synthetase